MKRHRLPRFKGEGPGPAATMERPRHARPRIYFFAFRAPPSLGCMSRAPVGFLTQKHVFNCCLILLIVVNCGGSGGHRALARVCVCRCVCVLCLACVRASLFMRACLCVCACVHTSVRARACVRVLCVCGEERRRRATFEARRVSVWEGVMGGIYVRLARARACSLN